jgi:hypothetical protein
MIPNKHQLKTSNFTLQTSYSRLQTSNSQLQASFLFQQPAFLHFNHPGGVIRCFGVVCNEKNAAALRDVISKEFQHNFGVLVIQIARRFVCEDNFRPVEKRSGEGDPLPFSGSIRGNSWFWTILADLRRKGLKILDCRDGNKCLIYSVGLESVLGTAAGIQFMPIFPFRFLDCRLLHFHQGINET